MLDFEIKFESHIEEAEKATKEAALRALTRMGQLGVVGAKEEIEAMGAVDTGRLRGSITYVVQPNDFSVLVGTNVEYAPYVHEGTGTNRKIGARPFLTKGIDDKREEMQQAIEEEFAKGV